MVERQRARQQRVDDAAQAPHVARESVGLLAEHFRRNIAQCAKRLLRRVAGTDDLGKTKIYDLWHGTVRAIAHHDVLELEIAMHDAELVQVLHAHRHLVRQVLDSLLWQGEAALLDVVEEVLALHVVENDEVGITVLEQVDQLDNITMLAHLEDLDLAPLLEDLNRLHVCFLDCLDRSLVTSDFVCGQLDHAELAFAQRLAQIVEVEQVGEAHGLEKHVHPVLLLFRAIEVENARFVWWEHDLDREESAVRLGAPLFSNVLHKSASQTVHHSTSVVLRVPVAEDLAAVEDSPVLLEPISLGLEVARAFHEHLLLVALVCIATEPFMDLLLQLARDR